MRKKHTITTIIFIVMALPVGSIIGYLLYSMYLSLHYLYSLEIYTVMSTAVLVIAALVYYKSYDDEK